LIEKVTKVVVTGGAGFIGSHLVDQLLELGFEVIVIDNLISGKKSNLNLNAENLSFVESDIRSPEIFDYFHDVDIVFHLAALADIVPSITAPYEYMEVNVMGTTRVLEASRKAGVKRFIYAASSSCYGTPSEFPTKETSSPDPQYPYALSKYLGEQIFFHWLTLYGLSGLSLRFFNVYGPRARTSGNYGAVLGVFLGQKRANLPLTIVGDGTQVRDFTYVSDVVDALILAGNSLASGMAINIGTSNPTSVNRLAQLIGGETVNIPKRPGEPDQTNADSSLALDVLKWSAKVSVEEGVARVLSQPESWGDAPSWTPEEIALQTANWFKYLSNGGD
jgi:UDP-glucose 4-epimerase